MPRTKVIFYAENHNSPVLKWIEKLSASMQDKALARIKMLETFGHELHRPIQDILRDGIHELRWSGQRVQYRILYGFHRRDVVILVHGLTKSKKVSAKDIGLAVKRLKLYRKAPEKYSYFSRGDDE